MANHPTVSSTAGSRARASDIALFLRRLRRGRRRGRGFGALLLAPFLERLLVRLFQIVVPPSHRGLLAKLIEILEKLDLPLLIGHLVADLAARLLERLDPGFGARLDLQ